MAAIDNGKTATIAIVEEPPTAGKENSPVKRKSETDSPGKKILKTAGDVSGEAVASDELVEKKSSEKADTTDEDATVTKEVAGNEDAKLSVPILSTNDVPKSDDSDSSVPNNDIPKSDGVDNSGPKSDDGAAEANKDDKQEQQPSVASDASAEATA